MSARFLQRFRWQLLFVLLLLLISSGYLHIAVQRDSPPGWYRKIISMTTKQTIASEDQHLIDMLVHPSLIGLAPEYKEREYDQDFTRHGGSNFTIEPNSGLSPASLFQDLVIAQPHSDVVQAFPQFRGLHCASVYPLSTCPFPLQCPPASAIASHEAKSAPCVSWAEGIPVGLNKALDRGMARDGNLHTTSAKTWDWDVKGKWDGPFWKPSSWPERPYRMFSPADAHMCLRGKTALFVGDSMIRQLYIRVLNFLRGIPSNCEHVWNWGTSSYSTYANGTDLYQPACDGTECKYHDDPLFKVIFEWHDPKNFSVNINRIIERQPDAVIHGLVYWLNPDADLTPVQPEIRRLFETGWRGAFSWYLTPERTDGDHVYDQRNAGMRDFVSKLKEETGWPINALPGDNICTPQSGCTLHRDRQPITSVWKDVHYMCHFNAPFPEPVSPGLTGMKFPPGPDNRDLFNFNLVQVWLNGICEL